MQFYSDQLTQNGATPKSIAATQITNLNSYLSKVAVAYYLRFSTTSTTCKATSKASPQAQQTLAQTQAGADPLDVQSDQLSVHKAQEALAQAETTLAEYYVTAPFAGTIASVPVNTYDQASSGTTIATLITSAAICRPFVQRSRRGKNSARRQSDAHLRRHPQSHAHRHGGTDKPRPARSPKESSRMTCGCPSIRKTPK